MVRKPVGVFLTVQVRGIIWRMMDFTERVPSTLKVFELRAMIANRHGGGVVEFTLYKESVRRSTPTFPVACHLADARDDRVGVLHRARRNIHATSLLTRPLSSATSSSRTTLSTPSAWFSTTLSRASTTARCSCARPTI